MTPPVTVSDLFPREHLIADDLKGPTIVTISGWDLRPFHLPDGRDEKKPLLTFKGGSKFLILNKTNAETMVRITGTDILDNWKGTRILLVAANVNGKKAIIVHAAPPPAPPAPPAPTA